jgi:hypothetical protein
MFVSPKNKKAAAGAPQPKNSGWKRPREGLQAHYDKEGDQLEQNR